MYVFISHSSKDAECAEKVCTMLEDAGHKCFIAPRDIRSGKEYAEELMLGIERSEAMVLLLSQDANNSPHVLREVEHAASRAIPIMVYKLEEVTLSKSMEYFLMTHQWVNQKPGERLDKILACVSDMQADKEGIHKEDVHEDKRLPKRCGIKIPLASVSILIVLVSAVLFYVGGIKKEEGISDDADMQLGSTVVLGAYNGEPVSWRVIHLSEDAKKAVLITEHIITMKAFDAAESERFNEDNGADYWMYTSEQFDDKALEAKVRGNNEWSGSCIRAWLNSDEQIVTYEDGIPSAKVMSEMKNGYEHESGFLYGFTQKEREAVLDTQIMTKGNLLSETDMVVTNDKVFLLNSDELEWLREADVSILAEPTESAAAQDETGWYGAYSQELGKNSYYWWLREPVDGHISQCYTVTNGLTEDTLISQIVGVEGFGVRPAVTVDVQALMKLIDN